MDGMIKGLSDVELGQGNDQRDESGPQHDEQSKYTWPEVVSGEQDNDAQSCDRRSHSYGRNQLNAEEQCHFGSEELPNVYSRPSRHNQREDDENNTEGRETVGKKPPRRPRKVPKDNWNRYKRPSSEQEYSDEVEIGSNLEPTEKELADLSQACSRLWELDTNRLVPGKDYKIDCGKGKKVNNKKDMAEGSFFTWLNEDILKKPTFSRFCALLDNYNPNEGCEENVTPEERQEQDAFIEEISRTAPSKYLHKYLSSKRIVSENFHDFKRTMTSLWFDLYGRGGTSGSSSAFEHVFVGEIKQRNEQEVSGFHNWLQFYVEEAKGSVDYQGFIFPRRCGQVPDSETQVLTIQFKWNGILKPQSSTFVGVSPEFEIALYTLCFYDGGEHNNVQLGPYSVTIKCHRLGDKIGSAFPIYPMITKST